jgi:hypothetical protein
MVRKHKPEEIIGTLRETKTCWQHWPSWSTHEGHQRTYGRIMARLAPRY